MKILQLLLDLGLYTNKQRNEKKKNFIVTFLFKYPHSIIIANHVQWNITESM